MCNADTGVLGQVWYNKDEPQAFPDFKTKHKCKNFEAIRRWGEIHQVCLSMTDIRTDNYGPERTDVRLTLSKEAPNESLPPDYITHPLPGDVLPEVP